MWINRYFESQGDLFWPGKVNLVYGPRRSGKTALIQRMLEKQQAKVFRGEGDNLEISQILGSERKSRILSAFQDYDIVFIDEAQHIPKIGMGLKLLIDHSPHLTVIASGSASFQLSFEVGAPLTGRSISRMLFPVSLLELKSQYGGMDILQHLNDYMIYGMYPEVLTQTSHRNKADYLFELRNAYLLKDILEVDRVKNSTVLFDLLRMLAFKISNEVSLNELANGLGIAKQTVARFLDLLEKAFIIKKLGGFSRNLRKEVTKTNRYYFYDNGIRNALINNFNPPESRNDMGILWENFMVMERLKKQEYHRIFSNNYFWRTYDQKEVDLVEEREGKLYGFEFKINPRKHKAPKEWLQTYDNAEYVLINQENFLEFAT